MTPAEHLYRQGRFPEAGAAARRALELSPDCWRSRLVLAAMARDTGDFDAAIGHARDAVRAAPDEPQAAIALAELLRNRDRGGEAAAVLEECIALAPERAELFNHLGLAWRQAGRPWAALAAWRRAARIAPDTVWAETNLAFGLLRDPGHGGALDVSALEGGAAGAGLGIFCDRFPHTYGFLLQQYSSLLEHFPDAHVYSFGRRVFDPYDPGQFDDGLRHYAQTHPHLAGRVSALRPRLEPPSPAEARAVRLMVEGAPFRRPRLAYTQFAMNADLFLAPFEALRLPFAFTLNPGGAFRLDNSHSDQRLRRVFASPWFRHVIVTYSRTRDYVIGHLGVPEDRVTLIQGTIVLESLLQAHRRPKRRFGIDKPTLDVCFAGLRYSPTGADKGYDRFIAIAHRLAERLPHLRLHVIGNFTPDIIDVGALGDRITFHGRRDQRWMAAFHADMDAIVSPNAADQLALGAFDGFPVTSCIEAGMCGVAVFATDPLGLNEALAANEEVVIIDRDTGRAADRILEWLSDPPRLYALAAAGERRFHAHWGETAQMAPRIALLERLLEAER